MGKLTKRKDKKKPKRGHKKGPALPIDDEEQEHDVHDAKKSAKARKKSASKFGVDSLLQKAQECIDRFDNDVAKKFCDRALAIEPDNVNVLETTASLLLETGQVEQAVKCLQKAVKLNPNAGHTKYLSLGQVLEGEEALKSYQKAVELLLMAREATTTAEVAASASSSAACSVASSLARDISSVYCSIAELYMTDCCFADDAEHKCKDYIEKAIEIDPTSPEAYQLKASYFITIGCTQDARTSMEESLSLWLPAMKHLQEGKLAETDKIDPVEVCPLSIQNRISAAQLLIELEKYDKASEVLDLLLDEDEDIVMAWYLLAWLNYLKGEDYHGNARFYLIKTKKEIQENFDI
ncbi:PREDICTED: probable assembly chaperone of rpl4 isoform X2 [Priapulus caudatus]|uniref:Probable assembly chaperone of rpl4 isoform X2 n=1 Tax=Priapulus caudatus TaxID=37621 RepID=A0ABM1E8Y7_PRICU|nr:PREDICTED: probable assembly chaperone of rpl4 isoform X2 [Priapulus caudatus]